MAVTVLDNGTSGLIVSKDTLTINESGSGNTGTFTVKLNANPAEDDDVTVAIGVWPDVGGKTIATVTGGSILKFTSENGTTAQTVTITGIVDSDDADDTGEIRVVASQDSGPYNALRDKIDLTVTDTSSNKVINVTPATLTIPEESSGAYSVSLSSQPTGPVTVWLTTSDTAPLATSPATLTFTKANYATAQTLTVHTGEFSSGSNSYFVRLDASGGGYDDARSNQHTAVEVTDSNETRHIWATQNGNPVNQLTLRPRNPQRGRAALTPAQRKRDRVGDRISKR